MTESFDEFNAFERSMWEQRATNYADGFEVLTAFTIEPLLDAVGVRSGTELLDVGTGPGFVAAAAVRRGATVTGIDVADSMVELAQARVPAGRFRRGSAEDLPVPDRSFDAVVGNFVILHLGHPDQGVAEARRVLRPGGRCAFTTWESPALNRALGVFYEAVERAGVEAPADLPTGPPMFRYGDHEAFSALLSHAGFDAITIETCAGTLRVGADDWWEATLRSTPRTGPLIARQTPEVRGALRQCYDELVAPYAEGADVVLPVAAVLASGTAPTS
jgi:ubiquinone/menaquinone biosynthesis C-methylase UbiE